MSPLGTAYGPTRRSQPTGLNKLCPSSESGSWFWVTVAHRQKSTRNNKYSLGQLTSTDLVSAKGKTKVSWLILMHSLIRQCFNILIRLCNPSRIRNIKIEWSKQLYHNNTLPLFSPLPKLGQWCDVSWPRESNVWQDDITNWSTSISRVALTIRSSAVTELINHATICLSWKFSYFISEMILKVTKGHQQWCQLI